MWVGGISGRVNNHTFNMLVLYSVSKLPNSEPLTMWQSFGHTNWAGWVVNLIIWSGRGKEAVARVPLEQRRKRRSNSHFLDPIFGLCQEWNFDELCIQKTFFLRSWNRCRRKRRGALYIRTDKMHLELSHCFGISRRPMRVWWLDFAHVWAALRWCKHSPRCQKHQKTATAYLSFFIHFQKERYTWQLQVIYCTRCFLTM